MWKLDKPGSFFDGFTIFGLKNFNDNISSFNPLMVKDIEVHKGGFDAAYGERVGGIVNITGKNGNFNKPSFSRNALNGSINSKGSSLLSAMPKKHLRRSARYVAVLSVIHFSSVAKKPIYASSACKRFKKSSYLF